MCEAFYLPLHFAEIGCRNAIHAALLMACGVKWYENQTFLGLLNDRFRAELEDAIADEGAQHGKSLTAHHIVSALTLGFWEHLTTKRFQRLLWNKGIQPYFPGAHKDHSRESLHELIESVRRWRNRIAHHRAIFDKSPSRKLADTMELIKWVCGSTAVWVLTASSVQAVINKRPTP
jgi:hypothetical protein